MDEQNGLDLKRIEVAVLMSTCNKYIPGKQTFYIQAMVPMKDKSNNTETETNDTSNLENQDPNIGVSNVKTGSSIELEVPKEYTRFYPKKFIPPGTRFLVAFTGGDITKPIIIGRDY
jgi:hypothetical protein